MHEDIVSVGRTADRGLDQGCSILDHTWLLHRRLEQTYDLAQNYRRVTDKQVRVSILSDSPVGQRSRSRMVEHCGV